MFDIYLTFVIINIFLCTFMLHAHKKAGGELDLTHMWTCIALILTSVIGTIIIIAGYIFVILIGKKK